MKYLLVLLFSTLYSFCYSQNFDGGTKIISQDQYVWGITQSLDKKYIAYSVGSSKTVILDAKTLTPRKTFDYNANWGGGSPQFSYNSKFMAYKIYGEKGQIGIYSITTATTFKYDLEAYDISFFNQSSKLLYVKNGMFGIFDVLKAKDKKELLNVNFGTRNFDASFVIDDDDKNLYSSCSDGSLKCFDMEFWKETKSYGPFSTEISNMKLYGDTVLFSVGSSIYVLNVQDGKFSDVETNQNYISDLFIDEKNKEVLFCGSSSQISALSLKDLTIHPIIEKIKGENSYTVFKTNEGNLLIGDENDLYLYKKK